MPVEVIHFGEARMPDALQVSPPEVVLPVSAAPTDEGTGPPDRSCGHRFPGWAARRDRVGAS